MAPHGVVADLRHLRACLDLAQQAHEDGQHPFAALLVVDGAVVGSATNSVVADRDATRHAELNLIQRAAPRIPEDLLLRAALFASTEPCAMCAGAILWAGIPRVVYACSDAGMRCLIGADGSIPCRRLFADAGAEVEVAGPLLEAEGLSLHRRAAWWRDD